MYLYERVVGGEREGGREGERVVHVEECGGLSISLSLSLFLCLSLYPSPPPICLDLSIPRCLYQWSMPPRQRKQWDPQRGLPAGRRFTTCQVTGATSQRCWGGCAEARGRGRGIEPGRERERERWRGVTLQQKMATTLSSLRILLDCFPQIAVSFLLAPICVASKLSVLSSRLRGISNCLMYWDR